MEGEEHESRESSITEISVKLETFLTPKELNRTSPDQLRKTPDYKHWLTSVVGGVVDYHLLVAVLWAWSEVTKTSMTALEAMFSIWAWVLQDGKLAGTCGGQEPFPSMQEAMQLLESQLTVFEVCAKCEYVYRTIEHSELTPMRPLECDVTQCNRSTCSAPRYADGNIHNKLTKQFFWFGLVEQLKQLMWTIDIARDFEPFYDPSTLVVTKGEKQSHLFRSRGGRRNMSEWYRRYMEFGQYTLVLVIATDGVNPWKKTAHSLWFIVVKVINYKSNKSNDHKKLITVGITSGPKEPVTMQFYMEMVEQELRILRAGVTSQNPTSHATVKIRADMIIAAADHLGFGKFFNMEVNSYNTCHACDVKSESQRDKAGVRQKGIECMRRYLPVNDPGRTDPKFGDPELRGPPNLRTNEDAAKKGMEAMESGEAVDGHLGLTTITLPDPRWVGVGLDLAHNIKVKGGDVIRMCEGNYGISPWEKPKYEKKVREDKKYQDEKGNLVEEKIPTDIRKEHDAKVKNWARYCQAQQKEVDFMKSCKLTTQHQGFADIMYKWCGCTDFVNPKGAPFKYSGTFNIHDMQEWFVTDVIKYQLYWFVTGQVYQYICALSNVYKKLVVYEVDEVELAEGFRDFLMECIEVEHLSPAVDKGQKTHELVHLYELMMEWGSPAAWWTYMFERYASFLIRNISDRGQPEKSVSLKLARRVGFRRIVGHQQEVLNQIAKITEGEKLLGTLGLLDRCADNDGSDEEEVAVRGYSNEYVNDHHLEGVGLTWPDFQRDFGSVSGFSSIVPQDNVKRLDQNDYFIKGKRYRCTNKEPQIGSLEFCRRRSGLKVLSLTTTEQFVCQLEEVYLVGNHKYFLVREFKAAIHEPSGLSIVSVETCQSRFVVLNDIVEGSRVVFLPWCDNMADASNFTGKKRFTQYCSIVIPFNIRPRTTGK
jgi:hypothetical protein